MFAQYKGWKCSFKGFKTELVFQYFGTRASRKGMQKWTELYLFFLTDTGHRDKAERFEELLEINSATTEYITRRT